MSVSQRMSALAKANRVRAGQYALKSALREGAITLAGALGDDRASTIPVGVLLAAQRLWGPERSRAALRHAGIDSELRLVRDLTARQREALALAAPLTAAGDGHRPVSLERQAARVMFVLAGRRGRMLTRTEIAAALRAHGLTVADLGGALALLDERDAVRVERWPVFRYGVEDGQR